jgi:hypothetical protein
MFYIRLSNEGDYFKDEKNDGIYRSTLNIREATSFESEAEAKEAYEDFGVRFMWREAKIIKVGV